MVGDRGDYNLFRGVGGGGTQNRHKTNLKSAEVKENIEIIALFLT
jgi:hypothetical protein